MYAAAFVKPNRNPSGRPNLQIWYFDPHDENPKYHDPGEAWFRSGHTGSGSISDYFIGETKRDVVEQAEVWELALTEAEKVRLNFDT